MKKQYKKPLFYKEPLVLTTSFASCNGVGEHQMSDPYSCSYTDEFETPLFYGSTSGCEMIMPDGTTNNGYICYNTPNDSGNILFVNS
jgi:hypothetical protein